MLKKTIFLSLAFLLVSIALADNITVTCPSGQSINVITNPDGTCTITAQYGSVSGNLVLPSTVAYNGTVYAVTKINFYAFSGCTELTSVLIPESVTIICPYAFQSCTSLSTVYFNCTNIVEQHFRDAYGYPNPMSPFEGDVNITSFIFGDSVTYIPEDLCYGLTGLTTINLPPLLTDIGGYAFGGCTGLTTIYYNAEDCRGNVSFEGYSSITTVSFGQRVKRIPDWIFSGCQNLNTITMSDSVEYIGHEAFMETGVHSVVLPESIDTIGYNAFYNDSMIVHYNGTLQQWCNIVMGRGAFNDYQLYIQNDLLRDLVIPDEVENIGSNQFTGCNLSSVVIPNHVMNIGQRAFYSCGDIETVSIGNGITEIPESAFANCSRMTNLYLGSEITSIDDYGFYGCSSLTEITSMNHTAPAVGENVFGSIPYTIPVNIPCGSTPSYLSRWNHFSNFVEMGENVFEAYSADETMGTVQILTAPTCTAPTAVIYANANSGYQFDRWSDGNTENPCTLTVVSDTTIVGYFVSENAVDLAGNENVLITVSQKRITVSGAVGERIRLFDSFGRQLAVCERAADVQTFAVPAIGTYLIQVNNNPARKVVVVK